MADVHVCTCAHSPPHLHTALGDTCDCAGLLCCSHWMPSQAGPKADAAAAGAATRQGRRMRRAGPASASPSPSGRGASSCARTCTPRRPTTRTASSSSACTPATCQRSLPSQVRLVQASSPHLLSLACTSYHLCSCCWVWQLRPGAQHPMQHTLARLHGQVKALLCVSRQAFQPHLIFGFALCRVPGQSAEAAQGAADQHRQLGPGSGHVAGGEALQAGHGLHLMHLSLLGCLHAIGSSHGRRKYWCPDVMRIC